MAVGAALTVLGVGAALASGRVVGGYGVETDLYGRFLPQVARLRAGLAYDYVLHPPGFSVLLLLADPVAANALRFGGLVTAASLALVVWLSFLTLRPVVGPASAAGGACVLAALLLPHSFVASSDGPFAALAVAAVWLLLRSKGERRACLLGAGLAVGAAYFVRTQGLFVFPGLLAGATVLAPKGRRLAAALLVAGGFLVFAVPWQAYRSFRADDTYEGYAAAQLGAHFHAQDGSDRVGHRIEEGRDRFETLGDVISADPAGVARRYVSDVAFRHPRALLTGTVGFPLYAFAGVGLLLLVAPGRARLGWAYLLPSLSHLLGLGLLFFSERFYLAVLPVIAVGVALPFLVRRDGTTPRPARRPRLPGWWSVAGPALLALSVLLLAARTTREAVEIRDEDPEHLAAIADWLTSHADPGERIFTRKPHVAFTAGLQKVYLPSETPEEVAAHACRQAAGWVFVDGVYAARGGDAGLLGLLDSEEVPAGLRLAFQDPASGSRLFRVRADCGNG